MFQLSAYTAGKVALINETFALQVKKSAMRFTPSENLNRLAKPKMPHPEFVLNREYPFPISGAAKKAKSTPRSENLAKPIRR